MQNNYYKMWSEQNSVDFKQINIVNNKKLS